MPDPRMTAIVTDACHFIGAPAAVALLADGHEIWCQDASFVDAEARIAFQNAHPGLQTLQGQSGKDIVAELAGLGGTVDVLVNNDAYPADRVPIETGTPNDFRHVLDALAVTAFERCAAVAPGMKDRRRGRIIFVTSAAPLRGLPNYSMYAAARGAANALARSLAMELAPHNIQVNAVAPNFIESPTYFPDHLMTDPEVAPRILKNVPLGRLGTPDEAGALIAFLAGPKAGFMTGQVIPLAGGWA